MASPLGFGKLDKVRQRTVRLNWPPIAPFPRPSFAFALSRYLAVVALI